MLYYAPSIFKSLGLGGNTISLLATGVVGIVMWIATVPAVLYVDQLGRKPVLIVGAIGMATCHIIIAAISATNEPGWTNKSAGWAACAMVWLFVVHFGYVRIARASITEKTHTDELFISLGDLAPGSSSLRSGLSPNVHTVLHLVPRPTG